MSLLSTINPLTSTTQSDAVRFGGLGPNRSGGSEAAVTSGSGDTFIQALATPTDIAQEIERIIPLIPSNSCGLVVNHATGGQYQLSSVHPSDDKNEPSLPSPLNQDFELTVGSTTYGFNRTGQINTVRVHSTSRMQLFQDKPVDGSSYAKLKGYLTQIQAENSVPIYS